MKKFVALATVLLALTAAAVAVAHHAAAGIVDEDIYDMIDALVADTPHGEFDALPAGNTMEITINQVTLVSVERMIENDLLTYASMLDGEVEVRITFDEGPRNVQIVILQEE